MTGIGIIPLTADAKRDPVANGREIVDGMRGTLHPDDSSWLAGWQWQDVLAYIDSLASAPSAEPTDELTRAMDDNHALRKLLWLLHGCIGIYGDDGELQCGSCMIDFKRDSIETINRRLFERGLKAMAAQERRP